MTKLSMKFLIAESPFFINALCDKYKDLIAKSVYNYIHDYKRFKFFKKVTVATGSRGHPPIEYTVKLKLYRSEKNNEV